MYVYDILCTILFSVTGLGSYPNIDEDSVGRVKAAV